MCLLSESNKALVISHINDWITGTDMDTTLTINRKSSEHRIINKGAGKGFSWMNIDQIGQLSSCYSSANSALKDLQRLLEDLIELTRGYTSRLIVITGNDYAILNTGFKPTFSRGRQISSPDLTMCTARQALRIVNWEVLDEKGEPQRSSLHIVYGHNRNVTIDSGSAVPNVTLSITYRMESILKSKDRQKMHDLCTECQLEARKCGTVT